MSVWKLADAESVAHSVAESSIPSLEVYEDPMHPFGGWGRGLGGVQPHGSSHHKGSKFTKRGFEYYVPEPRGKVKPTSAPRAAARGGSSHCSMPVWRTQSVLEGRKQELLLRQFETSAEAARGGGGLSTSSVHSSWTDNALALREHPSVTARERTMEGAWDDRFAVCASKANAALPRTVRSYFRYGRELSLDGRIMGPRDSSVARKHYRRKIGYEQPASEVVARYLQNMDAIAADSASTIASTAGGSRMSSAPGSRASTPGTRKMRAVSR